MTPRKLLSNFRKIYQDRFVFRCLVLAATVLLFFIAPEQFDVMEGFNFFSRFSVFHILWLLWMVDMILQLVPSRRFWPLGSQKFLKQSFQPLMDFLNGRKLLAFVSKSYRDTFIIGGIWVLLTLFIGALYFLDVISRSILLLISVVFYVCDIICVLFWCPFRVWLMKNRCCTTCRIFNWDHMMMFLPLIFVPGVFTWSLCAAAFVVFFVWEVTFAIHPERFWEETNGALKCSTCTDKLCGQRNCRVDVPNMDNLKM